MRAWLRGGGEIKKSAYHINLLVYKGLMGSKLLHSNKLNYYLKNCLRLFVHPSSSKIKNFKNRLKTLIGKNRKNSVYGLITILNPIIEHWVHCNFFSDPQSILSFLKNWINNNVSIRIR